MAIVQISRITQRKGLAQDLPDPLAGAELGWVTDERRLWIGNGTLQEGAPVVGNTEVLTEFSDILGFATSYTYQGKDFNLLPPVQTGLTPSTPVSQSIQSRLDSNVIITDFGATGDGVTDVTANINNALYQLYCQDAANPSVRRGLYFPAGVYKISNTLNIPPYCNLYGDGPDSSIISFEALTWSNTIAYASGVLVNYTGTTAAGRFMIGQSYTIVFVGSTDFTAIGAVSNTVGVTFTATGVGSGTGTATGPSCYRSAVDVPVGTIITNTTYWTPTSLPSYIARTADGLQQTGDNIGLNTNIFPGAFQISRMKLQTDQVMNGFFVESAQDCSFESVNISGPETQSSLTVNLNKNDTACVRWNSTASATCTNIEWNHCTFVGMVWGTNTDEQIESVTFSNCSFDTLYQGVYLGNSSAPAVGPTGFRIVTNNFNNIYAEGISIVNVGLNCSAYNSFYAVGNHFSQNGTPATPVIDINGTNNVSVGDMFQRTTANSTGLNPRIKLNNLNGITLGMNISNMTFYQSNVASTTLANQMAVGTYQRTAGIRDVLSPSVSDYTLFNFDTVYTSAVKVDYTIVCGTAVRTGVYTIVCGTDSSGTGLQGSDSGVQNSSTGVTFSVSETSGVVTLKYSTGGTGGFIYYSVTKLA